MYASRTQSLVVVVWGEIVTVVVVAVVVLSVKKR